MPLQAQFHTVRIIMYVQNHWMLRNFSDFSVKFIDICIYFFLQKDVRGRLPFLQNYPKPVLNIFSNTFLQKIFGKKSKKYVLCQKICIFCIYFYFFDIIYSSDKNVISKIYLNDRFFYYLKKYGIHIRCEQLFFIWWFQKNLIFV